MKVKLSSVCIGLIIGIIIGTSTQAQNILIQVEQTPLQFFFNGEQKLPNSGEEGFIFNSRTYVPIRFISEALGKNVIWDEEKKSISINDKPSEKSFYAGLHEFAVEGWDTLVGVNSLGKRLEITVPDLTNLEAIKCDASKYGKLEERIQFLQAYKNYVILSIPYSFEDDFKNAYYRYNLVDDTFCYIASSDIYLGGQGVQVIEDKILFPDAKPIMIFNLDTMEKVSIDASGILSITVWKEYAYILKYNEQLKKSILYKQRIGEETMTELVALPIGGYLNAKDDWIYCISHVSGDMYKVKIDGSGLTKSTLEEA